jgi:hypothetical protein
MRKIGIIAVLSLMALALAAVPALAQSGHFLTGGGQAPTATLNQTNGNLVVTGKVAGLGGTTFRIDASAPATAVYACQNNGGNFPSDPKKQQVSAPANGSTGTRNTPTNGQFTFRIVLEPPASTLRCPGGQHRVLASIRYGDVTVKLFENNTLSDTFTIDGPFSRTFFNV